MATTAYVKSAPSSWLVPSSQSRHYVGYRTDEKWQLYYRYGALHPAISTKRFVMAHESIWNPEGVHKKLSGFITAIDIIRAAVEVMSDQRFFDVRYIIKDLSEVTEHTLTPDTLADLAVIYCGFQSINPNYRIAFVTLDENLAKIIKCTLTSPRYASCPVETSRTISDAKDWLGKQPNLQHTRQVRLLKY